MNRKEVRERVREIFKQTVGRYAITLYTFPFTSLVYKFT